MSLRVDLQGNGTGFSQMLASAKTQAKGFSNSVEGQINASWRGIGKTIAGSFAGMLSAQSVMSGVRWFINTGKEIKDMAEQVNMSTDAWQKWSDAADRAGLSAGTIQNVLNKLQDTMNSAKTDLTARGQMSRLGFSDKEIMTGVAPDELGRRSLENAYKGDKQRGYLADVIGVRSLKSASVLSQLPNAQAQFSTEDIAEADEASKALQDLAKAASLAGIAIIENLSGKSGGTFSAYKAVGGELMKRLVDPSRWFKGQSIWSVMGTGYNKGKGQDEYHPIKNTRSVRQAIAEKAAAETGGATTAETGANEKRPTAPSPIWGVMNRMGIPANVLNSIADAIHPAETGGATTAEASEKTPDDPLLGRQREEIALAQQERKQRLNDSQRSLMTIGDRRASILGETSELGPQIDERKANVKGTPDFYDTTNLPKDLKGLNFLNDADRNDLNGKSGSSLAIGLNKALEGYKSKTDTMQEHYNKDTGDLKEKPLDFKSDSMSKVGLYSASAVAFNPLVGAAAKTNQLLTSIDGKLSRPPGQTPAQRDPHAP